MTPNAAAGYMKTKKETGEPRTIEYQVFQRVTAELKASAQDASNFPKVAAAIAQNSKLWAALTTDLLSDGNALPDDLRANLIGLAEFSRKHGILVLSGKEELEPLIDVNTAVMRGLRGVVDAPTEQSE